MANYNYIYCNKCKRFYFYWSVDFGTKQKTCSKCFSKNIKEFKSDSFAEMAQVERNYKINKIIRK
jgi:hypothetical protein